MYWGWGGGGHNRGNTRSKKGEGREKMCNDNVTGEISIKSDRFDIFYSRPFLYLTFSKHIDMGILGIIESQAFV